MQFKDCRWTALYLCDRWPRGAEKFFADENLLNLSFAGECDMLYLQMSDTAGIYSLRKYWIGQLIESMSTDCRCFNGDSESYEMCQRVTLQDIDNRLKELKVFYSQIEDGSRTPDGAIRPYEEVEPHFDWVRKHYLLA